MTFIGLITSDGLLTFWMEFAPWENFFITERDCFIAQSIFGNTATLVVGSMVIALWVLYNLARPSLGVAENLESFKNRVFYIEPYRLVNRQFCGDCYRAWQPLAAKQEPALHHAPQCQLFPINPSRS